MSEQAKKVEVLMNSELVVCAGAELFDGELEQEDCALADILKNVVDTVEV